MPTPREIINAFNTFVRMMANERGWHALIFFSMKSSQREADLDVVSRDVPACARR
jgi:hypothetical protein